LPKQNKKKNKKQKIDMKKTIINTALLIIVFIIVVYILYITIKLFIKPSNSVIIEKGTVTSEETAARIHNKRRSYCE